MSNAASWDATPGSDVANYAAGTLVYVCAMESRSRRSSGVNVSAAAARFSSSCAHVGLPADRPFVMYACSTLFDHSPPEAKLVVDWIRHLRASRLPQLQNIGILVRPHPSRLFEWDNIDLTTMGPAVLWGRNPLDPCRRPLLRFDVLQRCSRRADHQRLHRSRHRRPRRAHPARPRIRRQPIGDRALPLRGSPCPRRRATLGARVKANCRATRKPDQNDVPAVM
jgi:hypothetical protein